MNRIGLSWRHLQAGKDGWYVEMDSLCFCIKRLHLNAFEPFHNCAIDGAMFANFTHDGCYHNEQVALNQSDNAG